MKKILTLFFMALLMCGCTRGITKPEGVERNTTSSHAGAAAETPARVEALQNSLDAIQGGLEKAEQANQSGELEEAERLLNEVLASDPHNDRAISELDEIHAKGKHPAMIEEARAKLASQDEFGAERLLRQVLVEDSRNKDAQALLTQIIKKREAKRLIAPVLKTNGNPVSLEFRDAPVRMVFDAISRTTWNQFYL